MTKQLLAEIADEVLEFLSKRRSLELSTINLQGEPLASYAPFYRDEEGNFFILVSALAMHSANLENGPVSILVIADERDSKQIYARVRVGFQCQAREVSRDTDDFELLIDKLKIRHGSVIETLSSLSDFKLYKLIPESGRFIKGFGQAYEVNAQFTQVIPVDR